MNQINENKIHDQEDLQHQINKQELEKRLKNKRKSILKELKTYKRLLSYRDKSMKNVGYPEGMLVGSILKKINMTIGEAQRISQKELETKINQHIESMGLDKKNADQTVKHKLTKIQNFKTKLPNKKDTEVLIDIYKRKIKKLKSISIN